jgi:urea transport system permease protein
LLGAIAMARNLLRSKLGRLLVAVRDREDRVRFTGYDVAQLKTFVFVLAAMLSAVGGAMFTLQVGFMSPSFVGIDPSIEMVVAAAVGGRVSVLGAVYGSLLVNFGKTFFSENFPELWLFMMGALFIAVVMVFPSGLAGINLAEIKNKLQKRFKSKPLLTPEPPLPKETPEPTHTTSSVGGGL